MKCVNNRTRTAWVGVLSLIAVVLAPAPVGAQDVVRCGGQIATIVGTPGDDILNGTPGPDVIAALGGDDIVYGRGGDDILCGSHGHDELYGGDGRDTIYAFNGADRLEGGKGYDTLFGGKGADILWGGNGRDLLKGGPGVDVLRGGAHRDTLYGGRHIDTLYGGTERDTCFSPGDILNECEVGGGQAAAAATAPVLDAGPSITDQYSDEMFRLINLERNAESIHALSRAGDLDSYATDWAAVMSQQPLPFAAHRHHSPNFPNGNSSVNFQALPGSGFFYENVGFSTVRAGESVEDVIGRLFNGTDSSLGFLTSQGHYCNIVQTTADEVGLGSFVDADGTVWVVQVFRGATPGDTPVSQCR